MTPTPGLFESLRNVLDHVDHGNLGKSRRVKTGNRLLHHQKFRIGLSGCPNCCSQPQIKDFGAFATTDPLLEEDQCIGCAGCEAVCNEFAISMSEGLPVFDRNRCVGCAKCIRICPTGSLLESSTGWTVLVGGRLGRHPKLAEVLFRKADQSLVIASLEVCVNLWLARGDTNKRFGTLVDSIGIDKLRELCLEKWGVGVGDFERASGD